jgi:hypothetical protein
MVENLFVSSSMQLNEFADLVFSDLQLRDICEGDSSYSPSGFYLVGTLLGIAIKIDENNYDYEEHYNYMISIKKAIGTKLSDENSILGLAEIIASTIAVKLDTEVALEQRDKETNALVLKVFSYNGSKVITKTLLQTEI